MDKVVSNVGTSRQMHVHPGRVNLIREHTDYYEDFVPIPMVFPMIIVMVARARHDDSI